MHRVRVITNHLLETDTTRVDIERNPTSEVDIEQIKLKYPSPSSEYLSFDELLSPRDQHIRYTVRQFAQQEIAPIINDFYERAEFPQAVVSKFGKLKLIGLDIKGYGCPELTAVQNGLMALELARVSVGLATFCGILNNISMLAIYKCGSEEQKQKYLPKLASLELIGCFGLTEPNAGSDASNLQMTARPHVNAQGQSGWLLNGEKRWIGNGTHADVAVIWAKNSSTNQVNGFIVERGTPGLTTAKIENKVAMREVQNAHMTFKDVFVPDTQRLPKAETFATGPNQCLFLTRVIAGWIAVGCAMGAYDTCLQYVKQRTQFGAPLASFQIIQDRLVRMLGTINSLLLLMWRVSRLYDTHYDTCQSKTRATDPISIGKVSLAKSHCTSRAREVLQMAREVLGGNGLLTDYHVGKQFVDLEAVHTFEGSYDVNTLITAREVTGQSAFKK